ncbi:MAG TPA: TIM-barrel domain-containing protein [Lacunisphaera sp.]|jgi:alpha-D-xyloside xylohydrolase|nr:TIM-barrel domain-containing protein [Lacunisphaera sp.]
MRPVRSHFTLLLACLPWFSASLPAATGLDSAGQMQAVVPATQGGFSYVRLDHGVQFHVNGVTKNVIFYGPGIVRVNANLGHADTAQPSLAVVAGPANVAFRVEESPASLTVAADRLRIVADKQTGALAFFRPDGGEITRERTDRPETIKEVTISGAPTYDIAQTLTLAPDESLYGLGQYNRPYMDYRGQDVLLVQTNIGIVVPFLLSTKRYGILWDIYSKMTFKDDASGATLWAESAPAGVDYYFVAGDTMDGVIAGYRELTGAAPMFPKQAFGLFMSKERYQTQDRLIDVVRHFRAAGFPLDYIVQDWQYWGSDHDGTWSGMIWNKDRYPDPAALTRTLHDELHAKLMISIWPSIGNDTALAHELDAHGLRFAPLHWISKQARIYDAYSPEGRAIYFKYIKQGLLDVGVDALWMDGTEVEVGGACHDPAEVERDIKGLGRNALGDFTRYLNPYSLETTKGTYEGQRATGDKRVLTLTRSAWAGQQRYAALPWSGDTTASWATLRQQIAGGLNVAMAGLPYWTQDTGGFFVNYEHGEKNPEYQELYARWNQFAIFNPLYRIHGTSIEREPYIFQTLAPDLYHSLLAAARLRYALLPYVYSLAWQTTENGYTMMRGLPMDFPDDRKVRQADDAFMFGPAFLVHPVTRAMYHQSDPPAATIPTAALRTPDGRPGLAVQYFSGVDFNEPAGTAIDERVDHDWPGPPLANPPPGLHGFDNFSARWEGTITAPEAGEYEFGIEYDDGGRLYLDGRLLVDDWSYGARRYRRAFVTLAQGQQVMVKAEFHQGGQNRSFRLAWRTPSERRALANAAKTLDNTMVTYLPTGADWFDFRTNERFPGGATAKLACPLDTFPLYVRAGSIVPMGPADLQYATERPDAPWTIRVYPGADAKFTLYEDDGETYAYERGQRATCGLVWHDAARTLEIGARQGSFPGMVAQREMKVVLIGAEPATATKTVTYRGQPVDVTFR